jgi:hypothetical protein
MATVISTKKRLRTEHGKEQRKEEVADNGEGYERLLKPEQMAYVNRTSLKVSI